MSPVSSGSASPEPEEFTVDELAARAGMTVRNVRAYASRGLIDAPRLEGRTGYYSIDHLQRLQLIREFIDRGYTLTAVERAMSRGPGMSAGHTLDLLRLLDEPHHHSEPEVMSRDALAALAGVPRDDALIVALGEFNLVEWLDDENVRLLQPTVVRAGAAAVSLGLDPTTVISLFPLLSENLREIADAFVSGVATEIFQPFLDAGTPEDDWPRIIQSIESLLPVASQVTLGIFRSQLSEAIDGEVAQQLGDLSTFDRRDARRAQAPSR
ncbi:MAG: MerR family transcriptional regulator [Aeromicrobium sp.]